MGGGGSKNINQMVNEDWKKIEKNGEIYYLNIHSNELRAFLIEEMPEEARNETPWNELFDENVSFVITIIPLTPDASPEVEHFLLLF